MFCVLFYLSVIALVSSMPPIHVEPIQKSLMEEFDETSGGGFVHKTTKVELVGEGIEKTSKTTEIHKKNLINGTDDIDTTSIETYKYPNGTIMQIKKHGDNEKVIENVNCTEDEHCGTNSFCNGLQYTCVNCRAKNTSCDRDAQCCHGTRCINSTCGEFRGTAGDSCQSSEDCSPGHCCAADFGGSICKPRPLEGEGCGQTSFFGIPLFELFNRDASKPSHCPCQDGFKCQKRRSPFFMGGQVCSKPEQLNHRRRKTKTKRSSPLISSSHSPRPTFLDDIRDMIDDIFGVEE